MNVLRTQFDLGMNEGAIFFLTEYFNFQVGINQFVSHSYFQNCVALKNHRVE